MSSWASAIKHFHCRQLYPLAHVASPPQRRTLFRHTYTNPFIWTASHPTACLHATPGAQQTEKASVRKNRNQPPFAPPSFKSFFQPPPQQVKRLPAAVWFGTAGPQRLFHGVPNQITAATEEVRVWVFFFFLVLKMNRKAHKNFQHINQLSDGFVS